MSSIIAENNCAEDLHNGDETLEHRIPVVGVKDEIQRNSDKSSGMLKDPSN